MAFDKTLFNKNFDFPFKAAVANNMRIATRAFDSFMADNSDFLSDADELYGRLLAHAVKHQFFKAASSTAPYFLVSGQEVNAYKTNAVFLNTPDYITNICRTDKPQKLPCRAKYKQQLALGNREDEIQLEFATLPGSNELQAAFPKKYALLTYCYKNSEFRHLNIVVPDWRFQSILHSDNLFGQITEFYNYVPEEIVEENVASLKKDLVQVVNKNIIL